MGQVKRGEGIKRDQCGKEVVSSASDIGWKEGVGTWVVGEREEAGMRSACWWLLFPEHGREASCYE